MEMEQVRIDGLANNLANVNTAGFKQILTRVAQPDAPNKAGTAQTSAAGRSGGGGLGSVTRADIFHAVDNRPGPITATGRDTDVAVMGRGFFEIDTPEGKRYTRDGSFQINQQKQLVTPSGLLVQGDGGAIVLNGSDFSIASDGTVSVDGKAAGRLKLVGFDDPTRLEHVGGSMVRAPEDLVPTPIPPEEVVVAQGHLEGSNVNPINTLVAMITAQRAFEVQSNVLKSEDEMLRKSVNTLPQVR